MKCPACSAPSESVFIKADHIYYDCRECGTVFIPGGLRQDGMVGGTGEGERIKANTERVQRFRSLGAKSVLDYGCGNGALVWECEHKGLIAKGYDPHNPLFSAFPMEQFDLIAMVEVIEHLPFIPFEIANAAPGTWLYIESSFRGNRTVEDLVRWDYVNPLIGHSTIWSERGLDGVLALNGFASKTPFNQHVRIYRKE